MGKSPKGEAPDFTLEDLAGNSHALSDYRGKIVFLNFWATWCPPCRAEMPSMQKLHQSWDQNKYVMLAVNVGQHKSAVKDFIERHDYTFLVLLDPDAKVAREYYARSIPLTYVIDRDGRIKKKIFGARDWTNEFINSF